MHVTRRYEVFRYDGTNSAAVMERIYDYLIVSEADGVLTVVSHLGGPTYPITSDWAIIEYSLYSPEQFAQQFHVLPEPEPEP